VKVLQDNTRGYDYETEKACKQEAARKLFDAVSTMQVEDDNQQKVDKEAVS
jgi:hypothetical protein